MPLPRLVIITDWSLTELLARLDDALQAGPGLAVQHRHPGATARQLFEEGQRLAALCQRRGAALFINGRLDIALALDAHLHLPTRGVRAADARPALPSGRLLSVAVHSVAEAADCEGADFALVSPVFAPGSKPAYSRAPLGPSGFSRLAAALTCPAFALGGLTPQNARSVTAPGYAAISSVLAAAEPRAAARALLASLPDGAR